MSAAVEPKPRKQLSILVIQLGTIGECFRSLMALKAVKHLYPDLKIHVVTRAEASAPFKRVDWLESVLEIPRLTHVKDPVPVVAKWIDKVLNHSYDLSVNWTWSTEHTRMAAILTTLIPAIVKFGDGLRDDLTPISHDAWSIYHHAWANASSGVEQDIHPTDIITTQLLTALQIHVGDPNPADGVSAVTSRYFFKMIQAAAPNAWTSRPKNLKWVALHAGSLPGRIDELVEIILRRHPDSGVVILNEEAVQIDSRSDRVINLASQTHFDSSVQVLSQCQWLIAGQTDVVDLASLLNTRILQVVEGPGLKWVERGPYGNTHLACQFESEWEPELVYTVWSHAQSEWFHKGKINFVDHARNIGMSEALKTIQVYRARIRAATEGGGVSYERVALDPTQSSFTEFNTWIYRIRGQIARSWFCGWIPPIEDESKSFRLNSDLIKRIRAMQESLVVFKRLILEGRAMAKTLAQTSGSVRATYLMSAEDRADIESVGKQLIEVETLIARVTQVEPSLLGFLRIYQGLVNHLRGETIPEMAIETLHAFDLTAEGIELLEQYVRRTLDLAKPKALPIAAAKLTDVTMN